MSILLYVVLGAGLAHLGDYNWEAKALGTILIFGHRDHKYFIENEPFLHSMEKSQLKSSFLPYRGKDHHSILEMDTFKVMLLLSYLAHDFKSPFRDIEVFTYAEKYYKPYCIVRIHIMHYKCSYVVSCILTRFENFS